jgi:hypothetical protein
VLTSPVTCGVRQGPMTRSSMAPDITEHNDAAFWLAGIP